LWKEFDTVTTRLTEGRRSLVHASRRGGTKSHKR
jgi:hypothetical protein